jgi:hypothetical protein
MDRQIVCFAIPSLEIALARLRHPSLRTRPLAVATVDTPRALLVRSPLRQNETASTSACYARPCAPPLPVPAG